MKLLSSNETSATTALPVPTSEERELLERIIVMERHIADLRAQQARLAEAVRWAAYCSRGMQLTDVAVLLEGLLV